MNSCDARSVAVPVLSGGRTWVRSRVVTCPGRFLAALEPGYARCGGDVGDSGASYDVRMTKRRVTLSLDQDVVEALEAVSGRSMSAVANDALRDALAAEAHRIA
ncbi:MAG: BrnA antitoxin family protein, partial [Actinobacteria bacterium]|nr:BrnA antitoxin family protein [Actinomycetota bacterium]